MVSVVVPIYNASKYLDKCVQSILNQTYKDLELILINDGSIDNSLEIMKKYLLDKRVRIFSQENKGAAFTRNRGIIESMGKYILFVDSDDFIDLDYVDMLVSNIEENDVIVSGYKRCDDNGILLCRKPIDCEWSIYKYVSTCAKLYKTDFLKKNNINFSCKYRIGEDLYFTMLVIANTKKIKVLNYAGYNYYSNIDSVTNTINKNKNNRNIKMLSLLKEIEKNVGSNVNVNMQIFFYLKTIVLHLMTQRYILNNEEYYVEYKKYFDWFDNICLKYKKNLWLYFQVGEEFKINLICNLFILLRKLKLEKIILNMLRNTRIGVIK